MPDPTHRVYDGVDDWLDDRRDGNPDPDVSRYLTPTARRRYHVWLLRVNAAVVFAVALLSAWRHEPWQMGVLVAVGVLLLVVDDIDTGPAPRPVGRTIINGVDLTDFGTGGPA